MPRDLLEKYKKGVAFDPEGEGYDYEGAKAAGITPDETGHWASRDPKTGLILKGRKHKTYYKTERGEKAVGNVISKGEGGRYYSSPQGRKPRDLLAANVEKQPSWILEGLKETGKEFFQIGARWPKAILAGGESLQQGGKVGWAVSKSFRDQEKRSPTDIAQRMGDYLYHDTSTNMWWEAMKHLPFATLGKTAEIFADPAISLTFSGIAGVLKNPYVARVVGKKIPAPKWLDDIISKTVQFSAEPLKSLSKGVREGRITAIVETLNKNIGKRVGENYQKVTGTKPTENDIKGLIKAELVKKGIYGKSIIELQAALLKSRGVKPTTTKAPLKTVEPISKIEMEVRPDISGLAKKTLTTEQIAGLNPLVRDAVMKIKLKGAKGKAHRGAIERKYGEPTVKPIKEITAKEFIAQNGEKPQEFDSPRGKVLIHPSAKKQGKWQVTLLDETGKPEGDINLDSYLMALEYGQSQYGAVLSTQQPTKEIKPETVQRIVSKYPQHITNQSSLETVGNAIAKEMGITEPIKWVFSRLDRLGYSATHYKKRLPNYPITTIKLRVGQLGTFKRAKAAGGGKGAPTQGRLKETIVHELVHALPEMREKRVSGVMHPKGFYSRVGQERAIQLFKEVSRDIVEPKSVVVPDAPAPSVINTMSPEVKDVKPLPLGAWNIKDFPIGSLLNKTDPATARYIEKINEGIRQSMAKSVTDYQKGKNPYTLNQIIDTTIAFQKLEEKTGFPLYSKYYTQDIKAKNIVSYEVAGAVNKFTDGLKKGYQDRISTEKIIAWITQRKGSLTGEEKDLALRLIRVFSDIKDIVSYLRMRRFIDGVEKVPKEFESMVLEGEKIFSDQGREALEKWVKGKDFGVVRDDRYFPSQLLYRFRTHISADPFEVFDPYLHSREAKEQLYDASQSLVSKLHSYLNRIYSDYYLYDLLRDISNDLSGTTIPYKTLNGIKRWLVAIQGKGIDVGWWGENARKIRGQFFKVTLADPTKMARNYLQRYYMTLMNFPTLQHAIKTKKYFQFKLTDSETDYFMKHVSQLGELEREQLYLYDKFFEKGILGKVDDLAVKVAKLYTKIDQGNRWVTFKYALANVDQYMTRYMKGIIDLRGFMSKTGMSSFYPLETKYILSLPPEEARLEIAKLLVEKTQVRYKKVERGISAISELGEVATSLLQYPKAIITRYLDSVDMIRTGETLQKRWDGVRLLIGLIFMAQVAQDTLQLIAGKSKYYDPELGKEVEHNPYAIVGILGSLGIAGAQPAHAITLARISKRFVHLGFSEATGRLEEKERLTLIRATLKDIDSLGEAYIPFLKIALNGVEALEGTRAHKLLTTWFDNKTKRMSALRRNKIERDWIAKITHALFGRERE